MFSTYVFVMVLTMLFELQLKILDKRPGQHNARMATDVGVLATRFLGPRKNIAVSIGQGIFWINDVGLTEHGVVEKYGRDEENEQTIVVRPHFNMATLREHACTEARRIGQCMKSHEIFDSDGFFREIKQSDVKGRCYILPPDVFAAHLKGSGLHFVTVGAVRGKPDGSFTWHNIYRGTHVQK